jgi:hypothetical protein
MLVDDVLTAGASRAHAFVSGVAAPKRLSYDASCPFEHEAIMTTREPPVELFYDPEDLDPQAPRLRISKCAGMWELRDDYGAMLSSHSRLPDAIDAALERSEKCFSEILVMAGSGRFEWSVQHNPDWLALARAVNRPVLSEREAAD